MDKFSPKFTLSTICCPLGLPWSHFHLCCSLDRKLSEGRSCVNSSQPHHGPEQCESTELAPREYMVKLSTCTCLHACILVRQCCRCCISHGPWRNRWHINIQRFYNMTVYKCLGGPVTTQVWRDEGNKRSPVLRRRSSIDILSWDLASWRQRCWEEARGINALGPLLPPSVCSPAFQIPSCGIGWRRSYGPAPGRNSWCYSSKIKSWEGIADHPGALGHTHSSAHLYNWSFMPACSPGTGVVPPQGHSTFCPRAWSDFLRDL